MADDNVAPSISFDHDGFRLTVETQEDATAGTLIHLIATENSTVWHTVLNEDALPSLGSTSLNAKYLIEYIADGKEKAEGCSLSLKETESGIELTVLEERSKRRPPVKICFLLELVKDKEEKLAVLERGYIAIHKEILDIQGRKKQKEEDFKEKVWSYLRAALVGPNPLDDWVLTMSSEYYTRSPSYPYNQGFGNRKSNLLEDCNTTGACTEAGCCSWIQMTFPRPVTITAVLLTSGSCSGLRLADSCLFQYSTGAKVWKSLFLASGVDENHTKMFKCVDYEPACFYRLYNDGRVGVARVKLL